MTMGSSTAAKQGSESVRVRKETAPVRAFLQPGKGPTAEDPCSYMTVAVAVESVEGRAELAGRSLHTNTPTRKTLNLRACEREDDVYSVHSSV